MFFEYFRTKKNTDNKNIIINLYFNQSFIKIPSMWCLNSASFLSLHNFHFSIQRLSVWTETSGCCRIPTTHCITYWFLNADAYFYKLNWTWKQSSDFWNGFDKTLFLHSNKSSKGKSFIALILSFLLLFYQCWR